MKKIFIALSVLAALTFGVGSALAVPGIPDNTPGTDFTSPFLVSEARVTLGSGPTTVLNLTEVGGWMTDFHLFFYDVRSNYVADVWVPITWWGTIMQDLGVLIEGMSPTDRAKLSITFDGQPYFAGYIDGINFVYTWNAVTNSWQRNRNAGVSDNAIGSIYMLDLSQGKAGASNLPMREYYYPANNLFNPLWNTLYPESFIPLVAPPDPGLGIYRGYWATWAITGRNANLVTSQYPPYQIRPGAAGGFPLNGAQSFPGFERWSSVALHAADALVRGQDMNVGRYGNFAPGSAFPAQWAAPVCGSLSFYPEYYILDDTGRTIFMIYQNGWANGSTFHMYVINSDEDYLSTTITINEVTFLDAEVWIPDGLKIAYPWSGIFNWTPDMGTNTTPVQNIWAEYLGWSWQSADNGATSAATNWTIMKQMARDVGTFGQFAPQPVHVLP